MYLSETFRGREGIVRGVKALTSLVIPPAEADLARADRLEVWCDGDYTELRLVDVEGQVIKAHRIERL